MNLRLLAALLPGAIVMVPCLLGQAPAQQAPQQTQQQRPAPLNPNQPGGQQQPGQQGPSVQPGAPQAGGSVARNTAATSQRGPYILNVGDQLVIQVAEMEEIQQRPYRVDPEGNLILPVIGKLAVRGLTLEQFETLLLQTLKQYVREPQISVNLVELARGPQRVTAEEAPPIFMVGAFKVPGVLPLTPRMNLSEALTRAGGIDPSAARRIRVTRRVAEGTLPLKGTTTDASGRLVVAEITLGQAGEVLDPDEDIDIKPYDVLQANKLEAVYVLGDLGRVGPVPVPERGTLSLTQVLALSGGLGPTAKASKATILRAVGSSARRAEIPVDIKQVLAGRANDFPLLPNDVLVVPGSPVRNFLSPDRIITAGITVGLNALIFRALRR